MNIIGVLLMMAVDEKTKRFRTHVVKEIYETEKDYTKKIQFFAVGPW